MKAKLITYGGDLIPANGDAELDNNYSVTVTAVRAPYDDEDTGSVTVRHSWGATEDVDPARLGAYIYTD